jgi:hypothetical protein
MKNQDVPLTHARLLRGIWGPEYGSEIEYLRTYVRMLRKTTAFVIPQTRISRPAGQKMSSTRYSLCAH